MKAHPFPGLGTSTNGSTKGEVDGSTGEAAGSTGEDVVSSGENVVFTGEDAEFSEFTGKAVEFTGEGYGSTGEIDRFTDENESDCGSPAYGLLQANPFQFTCTN